MDVFRDRGYFIIVTLAFEVCLESGSAGGGAAPLLRVER